MDNPVHYTNQLTKSEYEAKKAREIFEILLSDFSINLSLPSFLKNTKAHTKDVKDKIGEIMTIS
jgi:hypothetical protein